MGLHDRLKSPNGSTAAATAEALGAAPGETRSPAAIDPYSELKTRIHHACIATLGAELFKRENTEDIAERVTRSVRSPVASRLNSSAPSVAMQAWWIRVFSSAYGSCAAESCATSPEGWPASSAVANAPLPFVVLSLS